MKAVSNKKSVLVFVPRTDCLLLTVFRAISSGNLNKSIVHDFEIPRRGRGFSKRELCHLSIQFSRCSTSLWAKESRTVNMPEFSLLLALFACNVRKTRRDILSLWTGIVKKKLGNFGKISDRYLLVYALSSGLYNILHVEFRDKRDER